MNTSVIKHDLDMTCKIMLEHVERLIERLQVARRALSTLQELTNKPELSVVESDAAIQHFETSQTRPGMSPPFFPKRWRSSSSGRASSAKNFRNGRCH
jgi:hypothetical protein